MEINLRFQLLHARHFVVVELGAAALLPAADAAACLYGLLWPPTTFFCVPSPAALIELLLCFGYSLAAE